MSNSATSWTQHTRLLCPPQSPGVCSNSCPLSWWYCLTISPSVASFSFCSLPSVPASGSFPRSQFFASRGQTIGASASVLPMNILGWFPLGLTSLISLHSRELSRGFSSTTVWKHQFYTTQSSLWSNSHPYITTRKVIALPVFTFVSKVTSLFNMLSEFLIAFLPRSKHLWISWLQSPSAVILEPQNVKSLPLFPLFPHLFAMK